MRLVRRVERLFYLSLVVALPVLFVATVGVVAYVGLRYGGSVDWLGGLPLLSWVSETVGGIDPLLQTVLVGVVTLAGLVALAAVALNTE